ncbi:MAG: aldehyde ferredoxin oxidoreductase family protein [Bacillota bacterium]|nr:aldehyde ferredoxin oxidoreductase family protein [Bacillota bacterium]
MSKQMFGYAGKQLNVDLSRGSLEAISISPQLISDYIGAKGFGAKILYDELPINCDPLSPENIVVLGTGPMTGTLIPASARSVIATKSPLTGIWLDTNCGGTFGPELKAAGYDLLKISGKSTTPVIILIEDDQVTIEAAADLWGKDTLTTHQLIKEKYGEDFKVACIGEAGEKQVLFAGVLSEGRSFGRGGAGAVLGSKNLKAIAVKGSQGIRIHNYADFMVANREAKNEIAINPDTGGSRPKFGTSSIYSFIREAGVLPVKNFQGGTYPGADRVDEHELAKGLYEQDRGCFACPIACSKYSKVKEGKYQDKYVEGPEYENLWSFGAQCGNSDLGAIVYAEYLCDYYGIDSVSTGNAIGFTMECFDRGIVTKEELGFDCSFGNDEAIIKLTHLIGKKEGFGAVIGQGVKKAAAILGENSDRFAMHVKGLELPAYDPRAAVGMGLSYATSDRGGCHLSAFPVKTEVLSNYNRMDPLSSEFKAELVKNEQDWFTAIDSLGICLFATFALGPNQITDLLYSLTGEPAFASAESLIKIGERINNLTRMFNLREGISAADDTLPPRLLEEARSDGPAKGNRVPLAEMLKEYYIIRGWDQAGKPKEEKLRELAIYNR